MKCLKRITMPAPSYVRRAASRILLGIFAAMFLAVSLPAGNAQASSGNKHTWLRAKITYEFEEGITGLSDEILAFSSDKWKKHDDGWYYYSDYVSRGDKIRFIDGIEIPETWTNDIINKEFRVIVTVQAADAVTGEEGFDGNKPLNYEGSYELLSSVGFKHNESLQIAKSGKSLVTIKEYQLEDGKEVAYQNDKVILPGQQVSKIVEFEIDKVSFAQAVLTGDIPVVQIFILIAIVITVAAVIIGIMRHKKAKWKEETDYEKDVE